MPTVIVVGSGIAGLSAALAASARHRVVLITKAGLSESNTRYAQGGIAAAVFSDDSPALHAADTMLAGAGANIADAVELLCDDGPRRVRELLARGVPFDRVNGELARGMEAAHSRQRVLHAGGDATGAAIEATLVAAVRETGFDVFEHTRLNELIVDDGRVVGVVVTSPDGTDALYADAVVLATGGAGRLFRHTTNPAVATGDGQAAALRAGAALADLEFYQFHPTSLAVPGNFLVSEAVRGEGAVLRNQAGERFMLDVHPNAELAPRDVVARGIAIEMAVQHGRPVLLDATALGASTLARRFPSIDAACRANGLDWAREPIPVTPAAHYWMGGVATDLSGRTSLPGLYAIGEVACTGVHGANRLASNSLLEGLVFAHRAVDALPGGPDWDPGAAWIPTAEDALVVAPPPQRRRLAGTTAARTAALDTAVPEAATSVAEPSDRLRALLWDHVGLHRNAEGLIAAARRMNAMSPWPTSESDANGEAANLLELGRAMVAAALARCESRGAHFRTDHPLPAPGPVHRITVVSQASPLLTAARR